MTFFIYLKATGEVISKLETSDPTISIPDETLGGLEVSRYGYDSNLGLENYIVKEDGLYRRNEKDLVKVEEISL